MSGNSERVVSFIARNWLPLAACTVFVVGLWYSSKMSEYRQSELEKRVSKIEALDERLRNIEMGIVELKTIVKGQMAKP